MDFFFFQDNVTNSYYLLYCRVICGDYCLGTQNMIIPDYKKNKNIHYETMVDNTYNPTIFVTTSDNQAYPLALIKIKM